MVSVALYKTDERAKVGRIHTFGSAGRWRVLVRILGLGLRYQVDSLGIFTLLLCLPVTRPYRPLVGDAVYQSETEGGPTQNLEMKGPGQYM